MFSLSTFYAQDRDLEDTWKPEELERSLKVQPVISFTWCLLKFCIWYFLALLFQACHIFYLVNDMQLYLCCVM